MAGQVAIRNCKGRQIDRSRERPISEPLPKPIPHRNSVEPQRRTDERLKKLVALRRVEPRPALHCGRDQIDAPHSRSLLKSGLGKRNTKNEKRNMLKGCGRAVPPVHDAPRGTRKANRVARGARQSTARFASAPLHLTSFCLSYALLLA